jgi:hypothetical protein
VPSDGLVSTRRLPVNGLLISLGCWVSIAVVVCSTPTNGWGAGPAAPTNPEAYRQEARVRVKGPALLGLVSGYYLQQQYVVGYRKSGTLGDSNDHVDVYLRTVLDAPRASGGEIAVERMFPVSREWHETGYLSSGIDTFALYDYETHIRYAVRGIKRIEVAFTVNGRWDSNMNKNYVFDIDDLKRSGETTKSKEPVYGRSIAVDLWDFVVGRMK